jgi:hypothetical protein
VARKRRLARVRAAALAATVLAAGGCAGAFLPAKAGVPELARASASYSASLRVSLEGPELRARTRALVAFRRPDALRVEVPGPAGGTRVVAVARGNALAAVFPSERAVFRAAADEAGFASLFGLPLSPAEIMDLMVGTPSPRLRAYRASWGPSLPRRIDATLPDGGRLRVTVDDAGSDARLSPLAFDEPPHAGYREVTADEARRFWSAR